MKNSFQSSIVARQTQTTEGILKSLISKIPGGVSELGNFSQNLTVSKEIS